MTLLRVSKGRTRDDQTRLFLSTGTFLELEGPLEDGKMPFSTST
jgi:hypothetical protein